MNGKDFDDLVIQFTDEVRDTLVTKGTEYVPDGEKELSRFHNFEVSAAFNQQHSTEALWGFLTKHLVSISDMVKVDSTSYPIEVWDEKLGDAMAYLVLLKGIVTENAQEHEAKKANGFGMNANYANIGMETLDAFAELQKSREAVKPRKPIGPTPEDDPRTSYDPIVPHG